MKPSGWWYLLIPLILAIGGVIASTVAAVGFISALSKIADYQEVKPGETATLQIASPGEYWVFANTTTDTGGRVVDRPEVTITDPNGDPVRIKSSSGDVNYSDGSTNAVAFGQFEAERSGRYEVSVSGDRSTQVEGVLIGKNPLGGLAGPIVAAVIIGVVTLALALLTLIVLSVRRGRAKRAQVQYPPAQYPPAQYPPAPPAAPAGVPPAPPVPPGPPPPPPQPPTAPPSPSSPPPPSSPQPPPPPPPPPGP